MRQANGADWGDVASRRGVRCKKLSARLGNANPIARAQTSIERMSRAWIAETCSSAAMSLTSRACTCVEREAWPVACVSD